MAGPEDIFQGFMEPGYKYTYWECSRRGHEWVKQPVQWFRWGWRLPWVQRNMFKKCQDCGIFQKLPGHHHWVWPKFPS